MTDRFLTGQPLLDRMEARLADLLAEHHVPGCSVAAIQAGRVAGRIVAGCVDADTGEPITPDTIFEGASLSKPLFTYAVMKLVEQGRLELDRPLSAYLPEPYLPETPWLERVTARMVLIHTTGWPNWRPTGEPLCFLHEPGTQFTYSGEGFGYLQHVVAALIDQPLESYLQQHLLVPLGMHDSGYVWRPGYEATAARGHDAQGIPLPKRQHQQVNTAFSLYSTPTDYARLLLALLDPPAADEHCLTSGSIEAMLRPAWQVEEPVFRTLGWAVRCAAGGEVDVVFHGGDNRGFKCFAIAWPAERVGLVVMTNGDNGRAFYTQLLEEALGSAAVRDCFRTGASPSPVRK